MPALRRRRGAGEGRGVAPAVPWALGELLRLGPAPLVDRAVNSAESLDVALVLGPGCAHARSAGVPPELLEALKVEGVDVRVVTADDAEEIAAAGAGNAPAAEDVPAGDDLARADVVLAAGWPAAPAVLRAPGIRARAVLATSAPAPLAELGWTEGIEVLGPSWLGGSLPAGTDAAYTPLPVHRREDLVLIHGEEPFGLLAAAELHRRRDDLAFAVSGVRPDLELPFPFLGVEPGGTALAHAFASATVALAPPVRGWRPAAIAMLACGQAIVAPDDPPTRTALGSTGAQDSGSGPGASLCEATSLTSGSGASLDATASFAAGPLAAADAVETLLADVTLRAERARAGFAHVTSGWSATAAALAAALRALP